MNVASPEAVTVTPDGRYLYMVNWHQAGIGGNSLLFGFAVDANTGALSPVPGPLTVPARAPGSVVIDPSGKFLYLADTFSEQVIHACCVFGFAIDASTGALSQMPGAFDLGGTVESMAASGGFLIAAVFPVPPASTCTLSVLSVDPATGALSSVSDSTVGQLCGSVAADSSLPYVYYGVGYESQTGDSIFAYYLDHATGTLTPIETAHVPAPTMGMVTIGALAVTH